MRILFDENMPYAFARELVGYECTSVMRLNWRGTENGALLSRAEQAGFEVLVTLDDDMRGEQNMDGRKIALLIVKPAGQGKAAMRAMTGEVLLALAGIQPGELCVVSCKAEI